MDLQQIVNKEFIPKGISGYSTAVRTLEARREELTKQLQKIWRENPTLLEEAHLTASETLSIYKKIKDTIEEVKFELLNEESILNQYLEQEKQKREAEQKKKENMKLLQDYQKLRKLSSAKFQFEKDLEDVLLNAYQLLSQFEEYPSVHRQMRQNLCQKLNEKVQNGIFVILDTECELRITCSEHFDILRSLNHLTVLDERIDYCVRCILRFGHNGLEAQRESAGMKFMKTNEGEKSVILTTKSIFELISFLQSFSLDVSFLSNGLRRYLDGLYRQNLPLDIEKAVLMFQEVISVERRIQNILSPFTISEYCTNLDKIYKTVQCERDLTEIRDLCLKTDFEGIEFAFPCPKDMPINDSRFDLYLRMHKSDKFEKRRISQACKLAIEKIYESNYAAGKIFVLFPKLLAVHKSVAQEYSQVALLFYNDLQTLSWIASGYPKQNYCLLPEASKYREMAIKSQCALIEREMNQIQNIVDENCRIATTETLLSVQKILKDTVLAWKNILCESDLLFLNEVFDSFWLRCSDKILQVDDFSVDDCEYLKQIGKSIMLDKSFFRFTNSSTHTFTRLSALLDIVSNSLSETKAEYIQGKFSNLVMNDELVVLVRKMFADTENRKEFIDLLNSSK